jgi:hypothetical protein
MKNKLLTCIALAAGLTFAAAPADAATLTAQGITYQLDLTSITNGGLTGNFVLAISGINAATDLEGGRTGINAFAFGDPSIGNAVAGVSSGFTFLTGGLNSGGCNSNGNFFCFTNTSTIFPDPLSGSLSLVFSVTSDSIGSWINWAPDFKIDWVGSKNNYDLVSQTIPVNNCSSGTCPTPDPQSAVPEPATWAMMLLGFAGIGAAMRRRNRTGGKLLQLA